jgi:hypothetical protein
VVPVIEGEIMTRSAGLWAAVAGVAWLVGLAQFVLTVAEAGVGLPFVLIGVAVYGAWALALGVLLLRRPTRTILTVSLVFAVITVLLNWPTLPAPSLDGPYWLTWLPDVVAGISSLAGLIAARRKQEAAAL